MPELEEVQQDIVALEREIRSLKSKVSDANRYQDENQIKVPDVYKAFVSENISLANLLQKPDVTEVSINVSPKKPVAGNSLSFGSSHLIDSSIRSNFTISDQSESIAGFKSITDFIQWENSVRLCGISLFPVSYDKVEYLGIRLEVFDECLLQYRPPWYIILRPSVKAPDTWELFKHNLPKHVQVHKHWDQASDNGYTRYEEILNFANMCYKDLLTVSARIQLFNKLDQNRDLYDGFTLLKIDSMGLNVTFEFDSKTVTIKSDEYSEIVVSTINDQADMRLLGPLYDLPDKLQSLSSM